MQQQPKTKSKSEDVVHGLDQFIINMEESLLGSTHCTPVKSLALVRDSNNRPPFMDQLQQPGED